MKKLLDNPFGSSAPSRSNQTFDEENPFEEPIAAPAAKVKSTKKTSAYATKNTDPEISASSSTRTLGFSMPTLPSFGINASSNPQPQGEKDLAAREAALKARETKMAELEKQLQKREEEVAKAEGQQKNWPIPGRFAVVYHSIRDDIPSQHQSFVRHFYIFVRWFWLMLFFNFITVTLLAFSSSTGVSILDFIMSGFYLVVGVYGSFWFWYYRVYQAMKSNGRSNWMTFWLGWICHILFTALCTTGVIAAAGIIPFLKATGAGQTQILFCAICMIAWCLTSFATLILTKRVHSRWRAGGGNVNDMKGAVAGQVLRSQVFG